MTPATKLSASTAQALLPSVPLFESPFFDASWAEELGERAYAVATALRERGYALIDAVEPRFDALATEIVRQLEPHYPWDDWRASGTTNMRLQDAWRNCEEVRELANLESISGVLAKVYGRPMFPFQTLNFACGSQQHLHADAVHFNTVPDGWMCGVWVALEDVDGDNGPLMYVPGSHRWRFAQNLDIGRVAEAGESHQGRFHDLWEALVATSALPVERFMARRGQALVWSAHLLHGGDTHRLRERTRWSQVTHFYGLDCLYLTPMRSNPAVGPIAAREPTDVRTGEVVRNAYLGATIDLEQLRTFTASTVDRETFDPASYLRFNPDVAEAGVDPLEHYIRHGRFENRRVR